MQAATKKIKKAISLFEEKKYQQSAELLQEAIRLQNNSLEAWHYLGMSMMRLGQGKNALQAFKNALQIQPNHHETQYALGQLHVAANDTGMALRHLMNAANIQPTNSKYVLHFLSVVSQLRFNASEPEVLSTVSGLMVQPFVEGDLIARTWCSLFRFSPSYSQIASFAESNEKVSIDFLYDPQLINSLAYTTIQDAELEDLLVKIRRKIVLGKEYWQHDPFLAAMALQCFNNEYLWDVSEEEQAFVDTTLAKKSVTDITTSELLLLASYMPLHRHPNIAEFESLLNQGDFGRAVWKRQVAEPQTERAISESIPSLTPIVDEISDKVREQYEENPYPRWDTLNVFPATTLKKYLTDFFPSSLSHYFQLLPAKPKALIAGVGTGRQVLTGATVLKEIEYTGIDLSKASISYGMRKQRELYPTAKIQWAQADILRLSESFKPESFDVIECCGVLHHMDDPLAGWKVLTDLLKPKGLMKIALYSQLARQHISYTRKHIAEHGLTSDASGIRYVRSMVKKGDFLPKVSTESLLNSKDFYSLSGCRDLLFHVQEHQFTLPEIKEAIQKLGLTFIGMELITNPADTPLIDFLRSCDRAPTLDQWNEYEVAHPSTFGRMYQFWLQKE